VTGKNATLHLEQTAEGPEAEANGDEEEGEKVAKEPPPSMEFAMIDGKELDGIKKWIRSVEARFGGSKKGAAEPPVASTSNNGKGKEKEKEKTKSKRKPEAPTASSTADALESAINTAVGEEDESDEDFNYNSDDSDGGEPSSGSSSGSGGEGGGGGEEGSGDSDSEEEDEGIPPQPESEGEDDDADDGAARDVGKSSQFKGLAKAIAKETAETMDVDELESE